MKPRKQWHKSLTNHMIADACYRRMRSLDNPGFCIECGCESGSCEPDAREYECEACGERQVYGAEELMMELM
jgi:hypothetical protein